MMVQVVGSPQNQLRQTDRGPLCGSETFSSARSAAAELYQLGSNSGGSSEASCNMKLTPVTDVARFVSIDGRTIVRISRSFRALDAYYDPPVVQDVRDVWGMCFDESPDSFQELGQLQDVLKAIPTQEMVAAAALASPRRFAEMVAAAYDLGLVFFVASRAMWSVADHVPDAKRFCSIEVNKESLNFHVLLFPHLFAEQRELPGVYSVSFSLSKFFIQSRALVEEYPKQSRTESCT